jgi:hypothetical protein
VGKQKPLTVKTDRMLSCGDRNEARVKFARLRTQRSASGYFCLCFRQQKRSEIATVLLDKNVPLKTILQKKDGKNRIVDASLLLKCTKKRQQVSRSKTRYLLPENIMEIRKRKEDPSNRLTTAGPSKKARYC